MNEMKIRLCFERDVELQRRKVAGEDVESAPVGMGHVIRYVTCVQGIWNSLVEIELHDERGCGCLSFDPKLDAWVADDELIDLIPELRGRCFTDYVVEIDTGE